MIEDKLQWYMKSELQELRKCIDGRLNGNVNFQFNFKDGDIFNMNTELKKSLKMPEVANAK